MKTLLLICGLFTQTINCNYNIVLFAKDKEGVYSYAKINLKEAKKSNEIINIPNFNGICDSQLISIVQSSIYSSMVNSNDDLCSFKINSNEPSSCYSEIKSKFKHPRGYFEALAYKLGVCLATLYYGKDNESSIKQENKLLKELGELNISLSLKHNSDIECCCVCLIKEEQLEECLSTISMNSNS